jgi:hypothetical protein
MMDISSVLSALRKEFPVPDIDPVCLIPLLQMVADGSNGSENVCKHWQMTVKTLHYMLW